MIRYLIVIPAIIIGLIVAVSVYLQPNDLRTCEGVVGSTSPCAPVDAIVAVSGGDTNARTDEAIALYKKGWSDKLIFSGAAQDKTGPSNAAAMQLRALNAGVPESAIFLDEYSETTRQNAVNTVNIFTSENIDSIILVTSGYHQRRASLEFEKRAENVVVLNHPVTTDRDWSVWWWTNPRGWTLAISEIFKIIAFHLEAQR
jgi:uncharacterized SAM-binding protein YcdF (DUF218 family)